MKKPILDKCPFCGAAVADIVTVQNLEMCANFEDFDVCMCFKPSGECGMFVAVCDANKGGCGASSGWRTSPEAAADAWNRRCRP